MYFTTNKNVFNSVYTRSLIGPNLINDLNKLKTRWGVEGMNKIL